VSPALETQFLAALATALSVDVGVRAALGDPPRLASREGEKLAYPYASFGDAQIRCQDSAGSVGFELGLSLHVWAREGERSLALGAVAALRDAIHGRALLLADFHMSLLLVVFTDLFRDGDARTHHGVLRLRAVCEPK
jgi:hypothetical protein